MSNCTFSGNSAASGGAGGGIYINDVSDPLIEGCTFVGNHGGFCGGAVYMGAFSTPKIRDCEFIDNGEEDPSLLYGGAFYSEGATAEVVNCVFQDNAARYGGAIYQLEDPLVAEDVPNMDLINCTFINNEAIVFGPEAGGGAIWGKHGSLQLTNCVFVGNRATNGSSQAARGGAVGVFISTQLTATNCTFAANSAKTDGGGIYIGSNPAPATNTLDNCVFWANTDNSGANDDESAQIHFTTTVPGVTYSDLMNLVQGGPFCELCGGPPQVCCNSGLANGNIGSDPGTDEEPGEHHPRFVGGPSGTWTADGVYCDQACWDDPTCTFCGEGQGGLEVGQSKFTTGATYTADEHVGKLLNVNTTQDRVALIAANTVTTITVWGDLTGVGGDTDPYQIDDYRLDSSAGSPCIDAADNNAVTICGADLDGNERRVDDPATPDTGNGVEPFVDMGAYEFGSPPPPDCNANGTPDECDIESGTSLDCLLNGVPDECCPADLDEDDTVGASDLAVLLGSWGVCPDPCPADCECRADLDNTCDVEPFDLALLLGNWGPCQ